MQKLSGYFREGCRTCSGRLQKLGMHNGNIYFRRESNYGIIHWWTGDLIKRGAMKGLSWRIVRPQGALMRGSISGMGDLVKDICLATTNNEWLIASLCFVLCEHSWCSGVYMPCIFSPGTIQKFGGYTTNAKSFTLLWFSNVTDLIGGFLPRESLHKCPKTVFFCFKTWSCVRHDHWHVLCLCASTPAKVAW